jgi:GMP synthase (glutamine-hydrolysing)
MPKLLVCQHVPYEPLGTLDPKLRESGFRIRYVNFGRNPHLRPSLEGYGGLVILGGPMSVDDVDLHPHLATEAELVLEAIAKEIPILGICLGAQLIAKALGAEVRAGETKEIGWHDVALTDEGTSDPLLGHLGSETRLFQWHSDVFELPDGAVHLASSQRCAYQAFRFGTNVYGFQFHLEVDEPLIERWLRVPAHRDDIERLSAEVHPDEIRRETRERIDDMRARAEQTFTALVRLFGAERPRRRLLPSR